MNFESTSSSNRALLCVIVSHSLSYVLLLSSALDSRTGAKVAIKKLYRPFQSDLFAKRAYRELRLLKHMKHENVGTRENMFSLDFSLT